MKTHIIQNGVVVNTIMATVEEAQSAFPDATCIAATEGHVGWRWDGSNLSAPLIPPMSAAEHNAPILAELAENDKKTIRALRESMTGGDTSRLAVYEACAVSLRAKLRKE